MYCLIQLYVTVSAQLAPQKPLLKLFAVKAVGKFYFDYAARFMVLMLCPTSLLDLLASIISLAAGYVWARQRCQFVT